MDSPFGFDSFFSWLLVAVGMLFFGIAAYKGYHWDDVYPGYGKKDRNLRKLWRGYTTRVNEERAAIGEVQREGVGQIEDLRHDMETKKSHWRGVVDRTNRLIAQYPANLRQYENDLKFLLAAYRAANMETRTEPPPGFFGEEIPLDETLTEPPRFDIPEETTIENVAEEIHQSIERVKSRYLEILDQYPTVEKLTPPGFKIEDAS